MPAGSEPTIVTEAIKRPGKCLVSRDTEGPFIDTGNWARENDPYVYLSVRWVEEVARDLLGMVPKEVVAEEFGALEAELYEKTERLAALERVEAATVELEQAAAAAVSLVGVDA